MSSFFPTKSQPDNAASAFTGLEVASSLADKTQPNKSLCPSLSFRNRMMGFITFFFVGTMISMSSSH